jgi:hypothetical protein
MSSPAKASSPQEQSPSGAPGASRAACRSQLAFRQVNEAIRRLATNPELEALDVVCECENGDCAAQISLLLEEYEAVRRFPTRFLVNPNHVGLDERIVEQTPRYSVVEKIGPGAAAAIRRDPRKPTAPSSTKESSVASSPSQTAVARSRSFLRNG